MANRETIEGWREVIEGKDNFSFYNDDLQVNWERIQEEHDTEHLDISEEQVQELEQFVEDMDYSDYNEWDGADEDFDWSDYNAEIYIKMLEVLDIC